MLMTGSMPGRLKRSFQSGSLDGIVAEQVYRAPGNQILLHLTG